ncbi:MAG TPA: type VI secretion system tube protein Hcp [bacterium]|nr:type VI secretion system tube protein Hcp [bacterium]
MPLYITIGDLEGPVEEVGPASNAYAVESYSHGLNQSYGPEGAFAKTTGSANVQLFTFSCKVNGATPLMMQTLCQNDHYEEVVLYDLIAMEGGDLHPFVVVTMRNVSIADVQYSGYSEGEAQQTVSLRFSEIEWEIDPLDKETGTALGAKMFQWNSKSSGVRT